MVTRRERSPVETSGKEIANPDNRVWVTGVGLVTPQGRDRQSSWQGLLSGTSSARWLSSAEIGAPDKSSQKYDIGRWAGMAVPDAFGEQPRLTAYARWAAREALEEAQLLSQDQLTVAANDWGCVIGTSKGVMPTGPEAEFQRTQVVHELSANPWPNLPAIVVAREWGIGGPLLCPVAACATGLASLIRGAELIRQGQCDVVLAGSTDASLQWGLLAAYRQMGVLSRVSGDPENACCPFDRRRDGFLVGEGAAVLVLESTASIRRRGITPQAEWLGGILRSDPSGMTQLDESGAPLVRMIQDLLRQTGLQATEIDAIGLHGTATRINDLYECVAVRTALGSLTERVPVFGLKGSLGHLLGAAGSVETAACVLALKHQLLPPTANLREADPECALRFTGPTATSAELKHILKLSLGFGGHLAAAILRHVPASFP